MDVAAIGLGSNLGDRLAWLKQGRTELLAHAGVRLLAASAVYASAPCGGPAGQGDYLNAALLVETSLPPLDLLALCQSVETRCGRVRRERWGARTLDLDLLYYDDLSVQSEALTLPHPRLHERFFVLAPLCDLEPQRLHPLLRRTLAELAAVAERDAVAGCRMVIPPEGW